MYANKIVGDRVGEREGEAVGIIDNADGARVGKSKSDGDAVDAIVGWKDGDVVGTVVGVGQMTALILWFTVSGM